MPFVFKTPDLQVAIAKTPWLYATMVTEMLIAKIICPYVIVLVTLRPAKLVPFPLSCECPGNGTVALLTGAVLQFTGTISCTCRSVCEECVLGGREGACGDEGQRGV